MPNVSAERERGRTVVEGCVPNVSAERERGRTVVEGCVPNVSAERERGRTVVEGCVPNVSAERERGRTVVIGSLRGALLERGDGEVLVEVAGIGYRVTVSPSTAVTLGELGSEVFVHIHHHIREDAQQLFGFTSREERLAFVALLSAHGVGPALALAILSVHDPIGLRRVLAEDDLGALCLVPGVGKKTAARLLVELKSKLDVAEGDLAATVNVIGGGEAAGVRRDVREALLGLGYADEEIHQVLRDIPDEGDASEQLKQALKRLAVAS